MPKKVDPLNKKMYGPVSVMLTVTDVKAAMNFYQKAFGFAKRGVMNGPGKKPIHAELTLRGTTRNITIPLTWRTATVPGHVVGYLSGQTTLRRLDFGVGQGQWQSTEWVGNAVTVRYSLVLAPSASK